MIVFLGVLAVGIMVGMWFIGKGAGDSGQVILGVLLLNLSSMLLGLWIVNYTFSVPPAPMVMAVDTLSRVSSVDTVTVIQYTLSD
jgi:hypothetical protein